MIIVIVFLGVSVSYFFVAGYLISFIDAMRIYFVMLVVAELAVSQTVSSLLMQLGGMVVTLLVMTSLLDIPLRPAELLESSMCSIALLYIYQRNERKIHGWVTAKRRKKPEPKRKERKELYSNKK